MAGVRLAGVDLAGVNLVGVNLAGVNAVGVKVLTWWKSADLAYRPFAQNIPGTPGTGPVGRRPRSAVWDDPP